MTSEIAYGNGTVATSEPNAHRHVGLLRDWMDSLASENTKRAYSRNLADYSAWLDAHGLDLLTATWPDVDRYRATLTGVPATVARKLAAVSSFYRYARMREQIKANPVELVVRPKVDADHSGTQGLTIPQVKALLAAAVDHGPRAHALVALLVYTGIRLSEALNATTADYGHDSGHRVLKVRRKGGKVGSVAVPAPAAHVLNAYLGTTGQDVVTANAAPARIFTTSTGKPWAPSEAFRTVQRLAQVAGIEGKITPHSLRHSYATIALESGTALHDLQDSMGHADPRTTRRYDRARNKLNKSAAYDVAKALA
jgi:integrase/recombinase XerD